MPLQPILASRIGESARPRRLPQWNPEKDAPRAVARELGGTCLATSEDMEGRATPSPRPTAARARSAAARVREETREEEDAADKEEPAEATEPAAARASRAGVASCASEKKAMPRPRTLRPPNLSAAAPPMSWVAA